MRDDFHGFFSLKGKSPAQAMNYSSLLQMQGHLTYWTTTKFCDSGTIRRIDYPPSLKKLRRAGEEDEEDEGVHDSDCS